MRHEDTATDREAVPAQRRPEDDVPSGPTPLWLTGACPVLETLRQPCRPQDVALVAGWLDRQAGQPAGLLRDLDDLEVWLQVQDPVLTAARAAHLLATCLVPAGSGSHDPTAAQLAAHLGSAVPGPGREAARAVLLAALGGAEPALARDLWDALERSQGPAEVSGAVAALSAVAAYVHACFGEPELALGTLLTELSGTVGATSER